MEYVLQEKEHGLKHLIKGISVNRYAKENKECKGCKCVNEKYCT